MSKVTFYVRVGVRSGRRQCPPAWEVTYLCALARPPAASQQNAPPSLPPVQHAAHVSLVAVEVDHNLYRFGADEATAMFKLAARFRNGAHATAPTPLTLGR